MTSKLLAICIFAVLTVHVFSATVFQVHRDLSEINRIRRETPDADCFLSTPCGWAVYERYTRRMNYFMKNKCECPENTKCVRGDDDLSASAYVYRCKEETIEPEKPKTLDPEKPKTIENNVGS